MDLAIPPSGPGGEGTALQVWASQFGIRGAVESLGAVRREANSVLAAAQGVETRNESIEPCLKELNYDLWDAQNVLDELDYYRIEHQLQASAMIQDDADDQILGSNTKQMSDSLASRHGEEFEISTTDFDNLRPQHSSVDTSSLPSTSLQLVVYKPNPKTNLLASAENAVVKISREIVEYVKKLSDLQKDVRKALKLEENLEPVALEMNRSVANTSETASYITEPKVHGRDQERDQIINILTSDGCGDENLSIVAIVGNGGIGKTTLARFVYNDSRVANYFQLRMWIYVSVVFDEVKLTRQLLECLYDDRYEGVKDYNKLQAILENGIKSKKLLLVMDDIWEDQDKSRWDTFLTPLLRSQVMGNMILFTTRKFSVAKMISTVDTIELDGLKEGDFWSLFIECAFGNAKLEGHGKLLGIGRQIVKKLKGYPLAAKSVGALLKRKLDAEHWRRVLESNEWKYKQGDNGIIPALKVSYKYLPFHLQRCFSYCALFPKGYLFFEEQLVHMWIAQEFVCCRDASKRKEDIGNEYLNNLVEWGFFLREPPKPGLLMHDLIHDLALMVSSAECFTIDGLASTAIHRFVRHVSVITESAYRIKLDGTIAPNGSFKKKLVTASSKLQGKNLSTLILFGGYDLSFAETFRDELSGIKAIRVLRLEMVFPGVDSLVCDLSAFLHLRYLELAFLYTSSLLHLPENICKLYHLEVLCIKNNWGINTDLPKGMSNLINLRHFIASKELHAKIARVGKLVRLQELKVFVVRQERDFSIGQLRNLEELRGSLKICNLENVKSPEEAAEARLRDKMHLSGLHLSWDLMDTESNILEEFQPHQSLRYLRIDRYKGPPPTWLTSTFRLMSLQSLHLEDCRKWRVLPPLENIPFLKELHLIRMPFVRRVKVGPLEVLELRQMSGLQECLMIAEDQQCSNMRILEIVECNSLEEVPFLHKFVHLRRLQIRDCSPRFAALPPLPFSDASTHIEISNVHSFPFDEFTLSLSALPDPEDLLCIEIRGGEHMEILDGKVLAFDNLSTLKELEIRNCPVLTYLPWAVFRQLAFLKRLVMARCPKLFSSLPKLEARHDANSILPPSLEELDLFDCNVTGKQLSQLLSNLSLSSLRIGRCDEITSLAVGLAEDEGISMEEGLWRIPHQSVLSLEKLHISFSVLTDIVFASKNGLGEFASLKELVIQCCPRLLSSMVAEAASEASKCSLLPPSMRKLQISHLPDKLLPRSKLASLVELDLHPSPTLTSLELNTCTALERLMIRECNTLTSCEGLQSLGPLILLRIEDCQKLTSLQLHSCKSLRQLSVERCKSLTCLEGSCNLTSLTELSICKNPSLASLSLLSCKALEKLEIKECHALASWSGLLAVANLKDLNSFDCPAFVPSWTAQAKEAERAGAKFSLSLKKLDIDDTNFLTMPVCKLLDSLESLSISGMGERSSISLAYRAERFTEQQEEALQLLTSLKELKLVYLEHLQALPVGLHRLPLLEKLEIHGALRIMSLPATGLPTSLKELQLHRTSVELNELCRDLRGVLNVYINGYKC